MTDTDLPAFIEVFDELVAVFQYHPRKYDLDVVRASYFRAMKRYPLEGVQRAARACITTQTWFPKAVEWAAQVPSTLVPLCADPGNMRRLTRSESNEYTRAAAAGWVGELCICGQCEDANITAAQPLRYVPDIDDNGLDVRAFDPFQQRIVTIGHWVHGNDLRRWYTAMGAFYALSHKVGISRIEKPATRRTAAELLEAIFGKQDSGIGGGHDASE